MIKDLIFSPSEFAFGYSACKRCYYDLKIDNLRVSTPFPSIFSKLDRLQKEFYHEKSTNILNANIEPGKIKTDYEKLQKSENGVFYLPKGEYDFIIKMPSGSYSQELIIK